MKGSENSRWKTRFLQIQSYRRAHPSLLSLKLFSGKHLTFFFSQYVAQTKGCLHFFSVKILTFSLLQRFFKYFILNGHIWSLILFSVYLMRFHCSFSTAILLNLFLSFEGKWTEGLNIESLEHFAARKLYYAFCVLFYGIYRDLT